MKFNEAEKLAIVKSIDQMILIDGEVKFGEMTYLEQLKDVLGFDTDYIQLARALKPDVALFIVQNMSNIKKKALAIMLNEMAEADGEVHEDEKEYLFDFFMSVGIDFDDDDENHTPFDVSDIYFESSDHLRYENGVHTSGPHGGARRAVRVEPHIEGGEGYSVTVYNLDGNHPVWGNNVQVAPKQMKVTSSTTSQTVLRGYGEDPRAFGDPAGRYSNYGITIEHPAGEIQTITLHMHDRNVDIKYMR